MSRTISVQGVEFVFSECVTCGVSYAVPKAAWDRQRQEGGFHHCSNGHSQGWSKESSENQRLRLERDRAVQEQARLHEVIEVERRAKDRAQAETKRVQRRARAALCPCCNRSFANVARHMKTKHPDVVQFQPKTA